MGIRVRKNIGYGLTDLSYVANKQLKDDRIDPNGYLLCDTDDQEERWSATGYRGFLKEHGCEPFDHQPHTPSQDMMLFHTGTREHKGNDLDKAWDPWDSVKYDSEFGMPGVVLIIPFCMAVREGGGRWTRYDDTIDYTEESGSHEQRNRFVDLENGIHPFESSYESLDGEPIPLWDVQIRRAKGETDFRPVVPMEVRAICAYLKLFKDKATARTLKPLLYVTWG